MKEFDLEQTADLWVYVDLQARAHAGRWRRVDPRIRRPRCGLNRGTRPGGEPQRGHDRVRDAHRGTPRGPWTAPVQKVMQVLAAVMANGDRPLAQVLVDGVGRLRRGMSAVIVTPSLERDWVRPLSGLRGRGVEVVIVLLDPIAFAAVERRDRGLPELDDEATAAEQRAARALRHTLAEHDFTWNSILPGEPIAAQLVTATPRPVLVLQ